MRGMITLLVSCVLSVMILGCGGGSNVALSGSYDCSNGDCGAVRLTVYGSKASTLKSPYTEVEFYRVSVSGPGIEGEMLGEFPGDSQEGVIEGVPAGDDRVIAVSAVNEDERIIRAGESEGVAIEGGQTADVDILMEAVPIFVNIVDGSTVENTRLVFRVFSESQGPLVIDDEGGDTAYQLLDAATSVSEIYLDVSTGLGLLRPAVLEPGVHGFTVTDTSTGRFSKAQVRLLDGSKRKGAPLFSSSGVGGDASHPLWRFGQAISSFIPWVAGIFK